MADISKIKLPNGQSYDIKDTTARDAISGLSGAMVFKGTVGKATNGSGTVSAIPTSGVQIGHTYKIVDENKSITAANSQTGSAVTAKVGDTIVATATTPKWVVIPSGDEPSGTVTSITLKATSPIAIDSTSAITSSGTRTFSHADSGATAGSYGDSAAQTPAYGGTFKVPYITVNATGHVTGISEHTVKIPASDNTNTHRPIQVNGTEILGNNTTALNLKAGSNVSVSNSSGTVTIAATDTTYESKTAASGGTDVSLVTTGEKYTWNNKSNLAIGTTASTAAAGNHTHATSIATSSGTNQLTLAASTKYAITAGGTSYIFTTPPNTTYSSKTAASGGTDVSLVTTGEKYTWNNKSDLAIGTTGTTAAAGNHTHTTTLATDTGTSSITLASAGKYKLTAGGNSVIFTMPTSNNYSHPTGDGNLHVPATGTTNNGKFLMAGSTAGSASWSALPTASTSVAGIIKIGTGSTNAAAGNHNHTITNLSGTLTVAKGGTGATDAATARTNLGITPANIGAAATSHGHGISLTEASTENDFQLEQYHSYRLLAGGSSIYFKTPEAKMHSYSVTVTPSDLSQLMNPIYNDHVGSLNYVYTFTLSGAKTNDWVDIRGYAGLGVTAEAGIDHIDLYFKSNIFPSDSNDSLTYFIYWMPCF